MLKTQKVFEVDPDMKIKEELVSLHALNPFIPNVSSARSYMFTAHLSQALVIENGEDKIIQSGLETQLAENTFSKKFENDVNEGKDVSLKDYECSKNHIQQHFSKNRISVCTCNICRILDICYLW